MVLRSHAVCFDDTVSKVIRKVLEKLRVELYWKSDNFWGIVLFVKVRLKFDHCICSVLLKLRSYLQYRVALWISEYLYYLC